MKRSHVSRLLIVVIVVVVFVWIGTLSGSPAPSRIPTELLTPLELLPDSTLLVVEIRDVARRWDELRAQPAIAEFQDRMLHGSGLGPADLRRLLGNRAAVALLPGENGRSVVPVVVLRPDDPVRAESLLKGARFGPGTELTVLRDRGALWVAPAEAARRVEGLARGDGTSLVGKLPVGEIERRLTPGGLARGWLNPEAVAGLIRAQVPGSRPAFVEMIGALAAAELDAVRFAGFRRDLSEGRLRTEAVVGYDLAALPVQVAKTFDPRASSPTLPGNLPADVVLAASFRPEPQAWLPWLRQVAAGDPRGPLRNLDFWIDEFEDRSGRDVERDLIDALGEHAWLLVLDGEPGAPVQAAAIFETPDAALAEATLLDLRDWLIEQARGRTLGVAIPRAREVERDGLATHALDIWTPVGKLTGPAFLSTDGHLVVGLGERALETGRRLIEDRGSRHDASEAATADHASVLIRGRALSRMVDGLLVTLGPADRERSRAVTGFLAEVRTATLHARYEQDAIRMEGSLLLAAND